MDDCAANGNTIKSIFRIKSSKWLLYHQNFKLKWLSFHYCSTKLASLKVFFPNCYFGCNNNPTIVVVMTNLKFRTFWQMKRQKLKWTTNRLVSKEDGKTNRNRSISTLFFLLSFPLLSSHSAVCTEKSHFEFCNFTRTYLGFFNQNKSPQCERIWKVPSCRRRANKVEIRIQDVNNRSDSVNIMMTMTENVERIWRTASEKKTTTKVRCVTMSNFNPCECAWRCNIWNRCLTFP